MAYVQTAAAHIARALQLDRDRDLHGAYQELIQGIQLLLQGVPGDDDPRRVRGVYQRIRDYVEKAEDLRQHLPPTQAAATAAAHAHATESCPSDAEIDRILAELEQEIAAADEAAESSSARQSREPAPNLAPTSTPTLPHLLYFSGEDDEAQRQLDEL